MTQGKVVSEKRVPPYAPYRSWKNFVEKLRSHRPLPTEFDSSFWVGLGFSGSMISMLKSTMVALGLLSKEMQPTPLLEQFLDANEDKQRELYGQLMDLAYPDYSKKVDLGRMTTGQLKDFIASLGVEGDTAAKARAFFLGLAKDAGKSLSRHVATRTARPKPSKATAVRSKNERGVKGEAAGSELPNGVAEDEADAQTSLLLWGLFKRLPKPGSNWPRAERDKWIDTVKSVFSLEYKDESAA